jgi:hypothetical protein
MLKAMEASINPVLCSECVWWDIVWFILISSWAHSLLFLSKGPFSLAHQQFFWENWAVPYRSTSLDSSPSHNCNYYILVWTRCIMHPSSSSSFDPSSFVPCFARVDPPSSGPSSFVLTPRSVFFRLSFLVLAPLTSCFTGLSLPPPPKTLHRNGQWLEKSSRHCPHRQTSLLL